jgi:hypothetical protein
LFLGCLSPRWDFYFSRKLVTTLWGGNNSMPITKTQIIALVFLCCLFGALGGYLAASFSPVQGQIAIVDVQALLKAAINSNLAQTETDAKALTEKIKQATAPLVERGIIILDAQSVLSAPKEAYVNVDEK